MKQGGTAKRWLRVGHFYDTLLAYAEGGGWALLDLFDLFSLRRRGTPSRRQKRFRLFPSCEVLEGRCLPAAVSGYAWSDTNANSQFDYGEIGLANVCVGLYDATTNYSIAWTSTDSSGHYEFDNITPGSYYEYFYEGAGDPFTAQGGDSAPDPSTASRILSMWAAVT
jgi:hypothetical protein